MSQGVLLNQAMVTKKVSVPYNTIRKRQSTAETAGTYPFGTDQWNQQYSKGDVLIGKNSEVIRGGGGVPQETALPSLNGLSQGNTANLKDLQREYHFVGINKTDYNPNDETAPMNGLAVVAAGTAEAFWTVDKSPYPGDKIVWKFASMDPSKIAQYDGKPKTKIVPDLDVLNFSDVTGLEHLLVGYAMTAKSSSSVQDGGGVLDLDDIKEVNSSKNKEVAVLLKNHAVASAMSIIHGLVKKGVLIINTPEVQAAMQEGLTAGALDGKRTALHLAKIDGVNKLDATANELAPFIFKTRGELAHGLGTADGKTLAKEANLADEQALMWLSRKLGVLQVSRSNDEIDRSLQRTIVQHAYTKSAFEMTGRKSEAPKLPILLKSKNDDDNVAKILAKYEKNLLDFQIKYRVVFAELYNECVRYVIGTAFSTATTAGNGGRKVDLLLGDK